MVDFTILGQPYSKANSRRLVRYGSRTRSIKSEKALNYEAHAFWQFDAQRNMHKTFTKPVAVEITIFYPDRRQDLDPSLILDVMQNAKVYENDRLVHEMHLFRKIDKLNPRSEITVWEIKENL